MEAEGAEPVGAGQAGPLGALHALCVLPRCGRHQCAKTASVKPHPVHKLLQETWLQDSCASKEPEVALLVCLLKSKRTQCEQGTAH